MNVMSLRARTLDGSWYSFTVLDAPVWIGDDRCIIVGRKFSPIIKLSTITLGCDLGIYVGDILQDEFGEWIVKYFRGMRAVNMKTRKTRRLYEFKNLWVVRDATPEELELFGISSPQILLKYDDMCFGVKMIIGKYRNDLVVQSSAYPVEMQRVKQYVATFSSRQRLFLGDAYKGSQIIMCYGAVCIQNEFGAYDIVDRRYIIKED